MENLWTQTGPLIALAVFATLAFGAVIVRRWMTDRYPEGRPAGRLPSAPVALREPGPPSPRRKPTHSHAGVGPLATVGASHSGDSIPPQLLHNHLNAEPAQDESSRGGLDRLDTSISAMVCPECRRQYDLGATYCPHDGARLHAASTDAIADSDAPMICSVCSQEHPAAIHSCPEDGGRLAPHPDNDEAHFVPASVLLCTTCYEEFPPGMRRCPDDGSYLVPVLGKRSCGAPPMGVGPRRMVCPDCGVRYSGEMRFCARDRARLVSLN